MSSSEESEQQPSSSSSSPKDGQHSAFSSLSIWRSKIAADLQEVTSDNFKLRILLEQTSDLEQAIFGCLKDSLFELVEAQRWGLVPRRFLSTQRNHLIAQAAQELIINKNLVLELARENGLLDGYVQEIKRAKIHSVADYETLGQLTFAMLVWKANVSQDLSIFSEEKQQILEEGWKEGVNLVRRCLSRSQKYWAAQQVAGGPGKEKVDAIYSHIVENKLRPMLEEMAKSHHVSADTVAAAVKAVENLEIEAEEGEQEFIGDVDKSMVPPVKEMYTSESAAW